MTYYIIALILILFITLVPLVKNWRKQKRDYEALRIKVHKTFDKYCFLIDKKLRVKETNYYEIHKDLSDDQPHVLGNVFHCQTACDTGLCGTGIACSTCPIRMVLNNGFKHHRDFNDISATMHLYNAKHEVKDVDVKVDGHFTYIGRTPHCLITVHKQH